jgi:ethanolamine transporter EutH
MVGEKLGDGPLLGILVHNLVGVTGGIVFSLLVLTIKVLHIDSRRKGLLLGIAAGAVTIPLGCIPLAIWLGQPILDVIAFSILPHLVWGTTLGWIVGYGLLSYGHSEAVK